MSRTAEIPQTTGQAVDYGWSWLHVLCLSCKHAAYLKFAELPVSGQAKLGAIASKLYCKQCKGRRLEFALGAYFMIAEQPRQQTRRISFDGEKAVLPSRE